MSRITRVILKSVRILRYVSGVGFTNFFLPISSTPEDNLVAATPFTSDYLSHLEYSLATHILLSRLFTKPIVLKLTPQPRAPLRCRLVRVQMRGRVSQITKRITRSKESEVIVNIQERWMMVTLGGTQAWPADSDKGRLEVSTTTQRFSEKSSSPVALLIIISSTLGSCNGIRSCTFAKDGDILYFHCRTV